MLIIKENQVIKKSFFNVIIIATLVFSAKKSFADTWPEHQKDIRIIERSIYKYQEELGNLIEKKKKTRGRVEQSLQRIVEIHAELISLRKSHDNTRAHTRLEHPEHLDELSHLDAKANQSAKAKSRLVNSPLTRQLDQLLIKVQFKFATFLEVEAPVEKMQVVEKVIRDKRKVKRERDADVYLRKRSKVKLSK